MSTNHNRAGFFNIFFGLIIATLLLGIASYVGYHGMQKSGTEDWKTYRKEQYGFEFKYPEDWRIKENIAIWEKIFIVSVWNDIYTERYESHAQFMVRVEPRDAKTYLDERVNDLKQLGKERWGDDPIHLPIEVTDISGKSGWRLPLTVKPLWAPSISDEQIIVALTQDSSLEIDILYPIISDGEYLTELQFKQVNQILPTFKFTK